jgi:hypothetical protein
VKLRMRILSDDYWNPETLDNGRGCKNRRTRTLESGKISMSEQLSELTVD